MGRGGEGEGKGGVSSEGTGVRDEEIREKHSSWNSDNQLELKSYFQ